MRKALRVLGLVGLAALVVWAALHAVASTRLSSAYARWAAEGLPIEAWEKEHAARPADAQAVVLAAAALGIRTDGFKVPATAADSKAWKAIEGPLGKWLTAERTRTRGALAAPPEAVAAFLLLSRSRIDALTDALRTTPRWAVGFAPGAAPVTPPYSSLFAMRQVLEAEALAAQLAGDAGRVEAALAAYWSLQESLRTRDDTISVRVRTTYVRSLGSLLRWLTLADDAWVDRVRDADLRPGLLAALRAEAARAALLASDDAAVLDDVDVPRGLRTGPLASLLASSLGAPLRLMSADHAERLARVRAELAHAEPCAFDAPASQRRWAADVPRWNPMCEIGLYELEPWADVGRARLELDLTRHVRHARATRRATGAWPVAFAAGPGCPGSSWEATVETNGALHLVPRPGAPPSSRTPFAAQEATLDAEPTAVRR